MDYLTANYPAKLIREKLCLTDAQVNAALAYIETHSTEVNAEYKEVLQIAEDNQQYWEERNQARFSRLDETAARSGQEALHAKLQAWKDKLESRI